MSGFFALRFRPRPRFRGQWPDRLVDLFSCGVDYAGRSVLDVGCNMGILAYEIAKHGPIKIHGLDNYRPHIDVARSIFTAVPVESRFDCINLANRRLSKLLDPSYDVVLLLAVYHHLRAGAGPDRAAQAIRLIASRCTDAIIVRATERSEDELLRLLDEEGFAIAWQGEPTGEAGGRVVVVERNKLRS